MSFYDQLEGLVKGAVKTPAPVAPEPKPAGMYAAPAVAPLSPAASAERVHADPYDLERFGMPKPAPVFEPAPVAAPDPVLEVAAKTSNEPVIVKYEEPTVVSAPKGKQAFDASGALLGVLMPDGKFIAVTAEPEDALNRLSEADRRPIDWDEEKRVMGGNGAPLAQRTSGRIRFLLTQETEQQTKDRIANDIHRGLAARTPSVFDPEKTANAADLNRFLQR